MRITARALAAACARNRQRRDASALDNRISEASVSLSLRVKAWSVSSVPSVPVSSAPSVPADSSDQLMYRSRRILT